MAEVINDPRWVVHLTPQVVSPAEPPGFNGWARACPIDR
jgi:hypothetical protein